MRIVLEALKDQEQMVRGAASFALGQFAEHLQTEILSHYGSVLPCILNAVEDPSDEVKVPNSVIFTTTVLKFSNLSVNLLLWANMLSPCPFTIVALLHMVI